MTSLALVLHTEKSEQAAWRASLLALSPSAQEAIPNGPPLPHHPPPAHLHIWLCVEGDTSVCHTRGCVEARHPTRPRTAPMAEYLAQTPNVKVLRVRNPTLKVGLTGGGGGIWGKVVLRERQGWKTSRKHFMKQNLSAYHLSIKHHDKRQIIPSFSLNPI